jgi:hypothetical protein
MVASRIVVVNLMRCWVKREEVKRTKRPGDSRPLGPSSPIMTPDNPSLPSDFALPSAMTINKMQTLDSTNRKPHDSRNDIPRRAAAAFLTNTWARFIAVSYGTCMRWNQ